MRKKITGSTILVTGGAGFIGSHLVDRLIDQGAGLVIAVDNMFLGNEENLERATANGAILYKDDCEIMSSMEYIFDHHDIDIVFNCATKALNYSFLNPSNAYMTNVLIMNNLLELQRKKRYTTLCHFSTSEVYGTAKYEPMDEDHPFNPTTTYAAGKAAADIMLKSYVNMFDLDAFIVRPFNNYGPRQNWKGPLAGVIPRTVRSIHCGGKPVILGTGNQSRDFIYVHDTVDAVVKVYNEMERGDSVNISTNGQVTISDLINRIVCLTAYTGEIERLPARSADVECHNASNEKIRSLIDYRITPFEKGIEETVMWYRNIFTNGEKNA